VRRSVESSAGHVSQDSPFGEERLPAMDDSVRGRRNTSNPSLRPQEESNIAAATTATNTSPENPSRQAENVRSITLPYRDGDVVPMTSDIMSHYAGFGGSEEHNIGEVSNSNRNSVTYRAEHLHDAERREVEAIIARSIQQTNSSRRR
jgi:hypothetical protein